MCFGGYTGDYDAAIELSKLLQKCASGTVYPVSLRDLIKNHWDKLTMLAHKIHDEEMAERTKLEKAIQEVECLSTATLRRVLEGNENPETIELVKLYARKVLESK